MEFGLDCSDGHSSRRNIDQIVEGRDVTSHTEYKFTMRDYYKNCKTILTSEKAAMAMCERLCASKKRFEDADFGPIEEAKKTDRGSVMSKGSSSKSFKKSSSKMLPAQPAHEWVSYEQAIGGKAQFIGPNPGQCLKGSAIEDGWLLTALSFLGTKRELIDGSKTGSKG